MYPTEHTNLMTLEELMLDDRSAQRFDLHLPLRYRKPGEKQWRQTVSTNVSRKGLVFAAEEELEAGAMLEVRLMLEMQPGYGPEVVCRARVVRMLPPQDPEQPARAAVQLYEYEIHGLGKGQSDA